MTPRSPALMYYGAKWRLAKWIISNFPKHETYVETCGGSGAVILRKEPSELEIYNDLDENVVNFFRVLRETPDELIKQLLLTPYARSEFECARVSDGDNVEKARRFFVSSFMGISGMPHDKGTGMRTMTYAGQKYSNFTASIFNNKKELWVCAERLQNVQIENRDINYILDRYDTKDTLFYIDPPYVHRTRTTNKMYVYEWSDEQHKQLAERLKYIQGKVVLSGYRCQLYDDLYKDWKRVDKEARNNSNNRKIESLWIND